MPEIPKTSYEPYEWTDTENTPIFAEDLNHMEAGIMKAHLGQNILDIDTSIVENPTSHTPLLPTYPDSAMKDIITQLIKAANNEEYNYSLIGETQLKETAYPTLGGAILELSQKKPKSYLLCETTAKEYQSFNVNDLKEYAMFILVTTTRDGRILNTTTIPGPMIEIINSSQKYAQSSYASEPEFYESNVYFKPDLNNAMLKNKSDYDKAALYGVK